MWKMDDYTYFIATPEKAVIDILYYGMSPDIGQLDIEQLDLNRVRRISKIYPRTLQMKVRRLIRLFKRPL